MVMVVRVMLSLMDNLSTVHDKITLDIADREELCAP